MNLGTPWIIALTVPLLMLSTGCQPTPAELSSKPVAFLRSGKVSEDDLLLHFGTPTGRFENDRVLTWRLGLTYMRELGPASRSVLPFGDGADWQDTLYDLVVVFDGNQTMKRFRLIPVGQQ
ncbi:MAG TPA: hypothetical protein VFC46_10250 [Humisphaera sp.]|nr:hypothetical protein [Humisphaera sp.]